MEIDPGANVNKLVWLSETNPGLVGKTEASSYKAEVRLFPSTFGFRNVKLTDIGDIPHRHLAQPFGDLGKTSRHSFEN